MSISTEPNAAMEAGRTGKGNGESLKDYEEYGISFDSHDGGWYYDGDKKATYNYCCRQISPQPPLIILLRKIDYTGW